ncbi:MAG: RNA methyltransferase [Oligoflexales bacterium]|nr:RNA methyltransferase [Oligoflexales bacterium]
MTFRSKTKRSDYKSSKGKVGSKKQTNTFQIDSLSALLDYARHKPASVVSVSCQGKHRDKIEQQCPEILDRVRIIGTVAEPESEKNFIVEVCIIPLQESDLKGRVANRDTDLILALDHITDPRNLGALARSCAFFGVEEILIPKNRQVNLTDASVATSQGAFALTNIVIVTNLVRILESLKSEGYWVIGCEKGGKTIESVQSKYEKVVLVLGSEDKGLSPLVRKTCDLFVGIEGSERCLDSLNVSVAGGILLRGFQFGQKSKIKKKNP